MKNYVVFDFETTGFSAENDHVTQMAALKVQEGKEPELYTAYVKVPVPIPEKITELTGITDAILAEKGLDMQTAWSEFYKFIEGFPLIGHNSIKFDRLFLNHNLRKFNLTPPSDYTHYDTAVVYKARKLKLARPEGERFFDFAMKVMNIRAYGVKYNLSLACQELNIDCSAFTAHRADSDVQMTNLLFKYFVEEHKQKKALNAQS